MSTEKTLEERGARYGSFEEHATIAQAIQKAYRVYPEKWEKLPDVVKQGFTALADKIARALNGDPYYDDNYHDIVGYGKLMEDYIKRVNNSKIVKELHEGIIPFGEVTSMYKDGVLMN